MNIASDWHEAQMTDPTLKMLAPTLMILVRECLSERGPDAVLVTSAVRRICRSAARRKGGVRETYSRYNHTLSGRRQGVKVVHLGDRT